MTHSDIDFIVHLSRVVLDSGEMGIHEAYRLHGKLKKCSTGRKLS